MTEPKNRTEPRAGSRYGVMTDRWGWQPTARIEGGLPTWSWRAAPAGLVTRRQMREAGLAPGGAEPVAQVTCRQGRRIAYLYDRSELVAKRTATPAQLEAVAKALKARRWCPTGGHDAGYCIPVSLGECVDCHEHNTHDGAVEATPGDGLVVTGQPAAGAAAAVPAGFLGSLGQAQAAMGRLRQRGLDDAERDEQAGRWRTATEQERVADQQTDAVEVA